MTPYETHAEVLEKLCALSGCSDDYNQRILDLSRCLQGINPNVKDDMLLAIRLIEYCQGLSGGMTFNFDGNGSLIAVNTASPAVRIPQTQVIDGWIINAFDAASASVVDTAQITVETAPADNPDGWTTLFVADLTAANTAEVLSGVNAQITGGDYIRSVVTVAPAVAIKLDIHLIV